MKKIVTVLVLLAALAASTTTACADETNTASTAGASSGSSSGANAEGGSLVYAPNYEATRIPNNTPEAILGSTNNTAMCIKAVGAGLSLAGLGFSVSIPVLDRACTVNLRAQFLANTGHAAAAIAYLCLNDAELKQALEETGGNCVAQQAMLAPSPVGPSPHGQ